MVFGFVTLTILNQWHYNESATNIWRTSTKQDLFNAISSRHNKK